MNGGAVSIVYDGDGNRVAKTAKGVTTYYLVDGLNPTGYSQVVEELQGGAVTRQYTYGLQRISENQPINSTWTVSFYGYDGGGNVRNLTNSASTVTDTYEYDAFGNVFTVGGTTPNNYLYRGEQYDPDLGLYYLRARYYNPLTGRFMSRDSEDAKLMDPATLHRYLYAKGDPINAFDPTGRDWLEYKLLLKEVAPEAAAALTIAAKIICGELAVVAFVIDGLHYFNPSSPGLPWPVKAPCALYGIGTAAYAAWLALIAEL
jgi:RHS repeat-associated protein